MKLLTFHERLLTSFQKHHVRYLIVGGYAVNIYGYIRATLDMDIWIDKDEVNLQNLYKSFIETGYHKEDSEKAIAALKADKIISLFDNSNNKIDIILLYSTVLTFNDAYRRKYSLETGDIVIQVIGFDDLIKIKAGR
jgi:hypothetical protein